MRRGLRIECEEVHPIKEGRVTYGTYLQVLKPTKIKACTLLKTEDFNVFCLVQKIGYKNSKVYMMRLDDYEALVGYMKKVRKTNIVNTSSDNTIF